MAFFRRLFDGLCRIFSFVESRDVIVIFRGESGRVADGVLVRFVVLVCLRVCIFSALVGDVVVVLVIGVDHNACFAGATVTFLVPFLC